MITKFILEVEHKADEENFIENFIRFMTTEVPNIHSAPGYSVRTLKTKMSILDDNDPHIVPSNNDILRGQEST